MQDLSGKAFGRLAVTGSPEMVNGRVFWNCTCECGAAKLARATSLKNGKVRSCGCLRVEVTRDTKTTHGMAGKGARRSPEYKIWASMRNRCNDPKSEKWASYGGRGIKVCSAWDSSFEAFIGDMGLRPGPDYQIDRRDNDGPYSPENCSWKTRLENSNNRRDSRVLSYAGKTMTVAQWARVLGIASGTIRRRLDRAGWSVEMALSTPVDKRE